MKRIILAYITLLIASLMLMCLLHRPIVVDERTQELCREYAARDHEKEIAPERYKWLGKDFVNNYNWYESCINHTRHPVAQ